MRNAGHIILVGPMGAGKTTLGRRLAARLGMAFVDVDMLVVAAAGCDVPTLFATEGEAGFRRRETQALMESLAGESAVVATGGGAVLAQANRTAMRKAGRVVYLQVDAHAQLARLAGDTGRPLIATDDRAQRLADLQTIRDPLYRELADFIFDTSGLPPDAAAAALAARLATEETTHA